MSLRLAGALHEAKRQRWLLCRLGYQPLRAVKGVEAAPFFCLHVNMSVSAMRTASCLAQKGAALLKHETTQHGDMGEMAWVGRGAEREPSDRSSILP